MAHELDTNAAGEASIALRGGAQSAWHGLGQTIEPGDSIQTIQRKAGLNWEAKVATVKFDDDTGTEQTFDGRKVIFRSDTKAGLGVASDHRYNVVQPREIMEFFREFLTDNKLSIETAGAVRGGRIIWCLAKLGPDFDFLMPGKDAIAGYVRLQTSFDTTRATDLVATSVRQVCANTMRLVDADADRCGYKVNHSARFDATALQRAFGLLGEQHRITAEVWNALVKRKVTQEEATEFFCELLRIEADDVGKLDKGGKKLISTRTENQLKALAAAYANGPGANLRSAKGTAFGLLQAVTYYVDHESSVQDNYEDGGKVARLNSAWFGNGEKLKDAAQWYAADLAGGKELTRLIDKAELEVAA